MKRFLLIFFLVLFRVLGFSQKVDVIVRSCSDQTGISYVNIKYLNSGRTVSTDEFGTFEIEKGAGIIELSRMGFYAKQVILDTLTSFQICMDEDVVELNAAIISPIDFTKLKKKSYDNLKNKLAKDISIQHKWEGKTTIGNDVIKQGEAFFIYNISPKGRQKNYLLNFDKIIDFKVCDCDCLNYIAVYTNSEFIFDLNSFKSKLANDTKYYMESNTDDLFIVKYQNEENLGRIFINKDDTTLLRVEGKSLKIGKKQHLKDCTYILNNLESIVSFSKSENGYYPDVMSIKLQYLMKPNNKQEYYLDSYSSTKAININKYEINPTRIKLKSFFSNSLESASKDL